MKIVVSIILLSSLCMVGCSQNKPVVAAKTDQETIQYMQNVPASDDPPTTMTMGWVVPSHPDGTLKVIAVTPTGDDGAYDVTMTTLAHSCHPNSRYTPKDTVVYDISGAEVGRAAEKPAVDVAPGTLQESMANLACDGARIVDPKAITEQIASERDWGLKQAKLLTDGAKTAASSNASGAK